MCNLHVPLSVVAAAFLCLAELSDCLSAGYPCLSAVFFVCVSVSLSSSASLSVCVRVFMCVRLCVYVPVLLALACPLACLSVWQFFFCLQSVRLSACLSVCLVVFVRPFVFMFELRADIRGVGHSHHCSPYGESARC